MGKFDCIFNVTCNNCLLFLQKMWLDLYHNDNYINTAYGQAEHTFPDAGNSAILHLHSGDRLSIRSRPEANVVLKGTPTEVYSTFSAALLSPILHGISGKRIKNNSRII